jgi:CPA2 family monovalent cation:H+ antiporter-2
MMSTLGLALGRAVVVLALLLFGGQKLIHWWLRIVAMQRSQELFILNLLLMMAGAAWITEHAGLSLALGIIVALARFAGAPLGVALRTGLALAQAGEFGFVLLNQAGNLQLLDPLLVQIIPASMVLSMAATPFLIEKSDAIVLKFSGDEWMTQSLALTQLAARTMQAQQHVLIAGFGRSGQNLAKMLEQENIPYHALDLDLDPERIQKAQSAGANVSYGDAGRREILVAAGIHRASALVISYADTAAALRTVHFAHELVPSLPIIVRSYDDSALDRLRAAGATEVVPETIEGSLMLASHALLMLGVPLRRVISRVQEARSERYASLRGYFHGLRDAPDDAEHLHLRLHTVILAEGAKAIGKAIAALDLDRIGAQIVMVRRGKRRIDFQADTILEDGDNIVVRGSKEAVVLAEERLLKV